MFGLTILRILVLCEPLFCLARPQYFCCLPCPLTNDCENPYYRETPIPCREEPPYFLPSNGNFAGRGGFEGFLPQVPFCPLPSPPLPCPPLPSPSRPRELRSQSHNQGQNYGPDPNCINLTIKCKDEREAYEDPYNKYADWFRGDLPDGKFCWLLQCNDPSLRSGSEPQQPPPGAYWPQPPPPPPTQPPQSPPTQLPQTPPPSQYSAPEDSDDPSNTRRSGYSSYPEPPRRSNFFTNLFSLPGQLADSVLSGTIQLN